MDHDEPDEVEPPAGWPESRHDSREPGRLRLHPWPERSHPDLLARAEAIVDHEWGSLTEAVLTAHLLIEQALVDSIGRKFVKPEVLRGSRLGFAQLLTIYDGLYDPDEDEPRIFREFNRLRNKIAHTLEDPEATIMATLRNV